MNIAERKTALRRELTARRKQLSAADHAAHSRLAGERVLNTLDELPGERVALFWPLGHEIDTRPLLHALAKRGTTVLLPRTHARATPVSFHRWTPATRLERSAFGVEEPPQDSPAMDPEIVVVPLLGFDRACYRLGYGAGHYDCTLSDLAARGHGPRTLGLAFALQEVDEVPREPHDVPLEMIVTERDIWRRG